MTHRLELCEHYCRIEIRRSEKAVKRQEEAEMIRRKKRGLLDGFIDYALSLEDDELFS